MTNDHEATEPHGESAASTAPHGGEMPILDPQTVSARIAADGRAAFPMRTAMLVALAVFAIESTWSFYDSQVPPLIQEYVGSAVVIGLLMGMDNVLGIFLHPWIGNRSDRTRTRLGRRIPYLLAFAPVAALAFVLLPFAGSAVVLFVLIIVYALTANLLKPLAEALLPDFLPVAHRSLGTAVVKVGGSLAIVIAAVISLLLVDDHPKLAFAVPAAIMLVAIAIVALRLRERSSIGYRTALVNDKARVESRKDVRMIEVLRGLFSAPGHSALLLLTDVRHWVRRNAKTQLEFVDDWLIFSARIATRIGNAPLPPEVRAEFRQWADGSQDQTTWTQWGRDSNAVISDSHPRNSRSPSEHPLPFGHAAQGVSPVITTLQEQIASGELDPGSAISQAGLARLSGLSGSRVREALRLLSADGTVEELTANRFAVPAVTAKSVMDAYAARVTLGSLLLRSIIADRHADLTDIRNALDKVEAAVRDPSATEIGDADLNFQDSLARVSTMTHAATAFLRTTARLRLVTSSVRIDYSIIPERIVRGDRTIYHGLRGRDAQTAVGAWWSKANIAVRYMVAQLPTERFDAHYWSFSTGLPQP